MLFRIISAMAISVLFFPLLHGQDNVNLVRLVPQYQNISQVSAPVPNYGAILQDALNIYNLTIATRCHRYLNQKLRDLIWKERKKIKESKDFQIITDYSTCEVMIIACAPCSNTVLSKPNKKIHTYIIELSPIIWSEDGQAF